MTRHRTIILIVGSLVAFAGISSDAALASSLLSGYGGPGQGSQALLGSALLNGSGGGGGSAGAAAPPASSTPVTPEAPSRTAQGRSGRSHKHAGAGSTGSHGAVANSQPSAATRISDIYTAAERGASAPSTGLLGLSGADFLLIVLALLALGFMGVLTRRLTRAAPAGRQR
jgi:hypothetical protein